MQNQNNNEDEKIKDQQNNTETDISKNQKIQVTQQKLIIQQQHPMDIQETLKQQQLQKFQQVSDEVILKTKPMLNKIEKVQSIIFFQCQPQLTVSDLQKSSIQRDQFDKELKTLILILEHQNQIINPLKLVINKNIEVSNKEVLFYVLCNQLRKADRKFYQSAQPNNLLMYSFQGQFTAQSQDSQAYSLTLKETSNLTYQKINSDQAFRDEFLTKMTQCLSVDLKIPEQQIQIVAVEQGSLIVIFQIIDPQEVEPPPSCENFKAIQTQFPGTAPTMKLYEYFKTAALSMDDLAPKYNMTWEDGYLFGNYFQRGPKGMTQPYFLPIGWYGHALNVAGKYGNNDNWLGENNNNEEWYTMFHGTTFTAVPQILEQGFKEGRGQSFENELCLLTKQKIGRGVYFSNHIEVCEDYAKPTKVGDKFFILAFQSRIRPEALRQCQKGSDLKTRLDTYKRNNKYYVKSLNDMKMWDNDYFVVNKTCDIRPYRILIKEFQECY